MRTTTGVRGVRRRAVGAVAGAVATLVFHTDGPTTGTYDLTIRGYAVHITAIATTYT